MLWLYLVACSDKTPSTSDTGDSAEEPDFTIDSDAVIDTSPPIDTTPPIDTVDTSPPVDTVDTGGGDTAVPVPTVSLWPAHLVVSPGGSYQLRVEASWEDGTEEDTSKLLWLSSDEKIATISDDGTITAVAEGEATFTADVAGALAEASVAVRGDGLLTISVIEADSGGPVNAARVVVGETSVTAGKDGVVDISVPDGEAVDVIVYTGSSYEPELITTSIVGLVAREVVLPLRLQGAEGSGPVTVTGDADLSGCETGGWSDLTVGIAGSAIQDGPLFWDAADLLGDDVEIDFYTGTTSVPGNLVLGDYKEDYTTMARIGSGGVWAFAGPISIADATGAIADPGSALTALLNNWDDFRAEWVDGTWGEAGDTVEQDIAPAYEMSETFEVEVPELPLGFGGDEEVLALALVDGAGGHGVIGMAMGEGTLEVSRVPMTDLGAKDEGAVLLYAQVDGIGSGGSRVVTWAEIDGGVAVPPEWMGVANLESFSGSTHTYSFHPDERAHVQRLHIQANDGTERDYWFGPGSHKGTIPDGGPSMGWGNTNWTLTTLDTSEGTFESLLSEGGLVQSNLQRIGLTSSTAVQNFVGG